MSNTKRDYDTKEDLIKRADLAIVRHYAKKLQLDSDMIQGLMDYSESAEWTSEGRVKVKTDPVFDRGSWTHFYYEPFFDKELRNGKRR